MGTNDRGTSILKRLNHQDLLMSEEKYRMILNTAYDMILVFNTGDNRIHFYNPTVQNLLGYDDEDLKSMNIFDMLHPEDLQISKDVLQEGLDRGEGQALYRCRKKNGDYVWLEANGRVLAKQDDQYHVLLVCRDVSERKAAIEALHASENRLRQISDTIQDAVFCLDCSGRIQYLSPSHQSLLGYHPSELLGQDNMGVVHPEDRKKAFEYIQKVINGQIPDRMEYRVRHADGYYLWMEVIGNAILDDNGDISGGVFANRDITAHKKTEQSLWQSEKNLRNQVDYLQTLLDNMHELFFTYNRSYIVTYMNKKARELLGYSVEQVIGRPLSDFIPSGSWKVLRKNVSERLELGQEASYSQTVLTHDGQEILLRLKAAPLYENTKIVGGMVLGEDITETLRMEKEMARLAQLHTVGEMAASIGHEIRNPMTTVHGFLQIMSYKADLKKYQPYFSLMLEEMDRANTIIAEFLSLAKNRMVNLEKHNLAQIIKTLSPLMVADALKSDQTIQLDLEDVPDLMLDEKEVRQLILNLVRNALEASPVGGRVNISTYIYDQSVVLSVQDGGQGIPEEIRDKLGTPFLTTKEKGTGLGLAVCYSIVNRHNGKISFDTGPRGTVFRVEFPQIAVKNEAVC